MPRPSRIASLALFTVSLALLALPNLAGDRLHPKAQAAATFTVNSTGDGADGNAGDGVCADPSGNCTLRAAIQEANATSGADVINFGIGTGPQTITLTSPLPAVTDPSTIDATTQPGFSGVPLVVLSGGGHSTGVLGDGLVLKAGSSTVRGLVINGVRGHAVRIEGGSGNVIAGNYIGTDAAGSARVFNLQSGVFILNSNNNVVGGTTPAARNVISGCLANGVHIAGASSGNLVQGNYIGTNASGTEGLGNNGSGVFLFNTSSNNTVGGATPAARNVISGNGSSGVETGSQTSANLVQGNFIGTNAAGDAALANTGDGVKVGGTNNVVGGLTASPGAPPGNLLSGNYTNIFVLGTGTVIQGNLIGTDVSGTASLQINASFGVMCWGPNTLIGGVEPGARNVVSGNGDGILIANSGRANVQGNYVGTDLTGTSAVGNLRAGITSLTNGNVIGGTSAAARNVISGNGKGVEIQSSSATVQGNYVGTNAGGTAGVPNGVGVALSCLGSQGGCLVGGAEEGAGNRIAYNTQSGVVVGRNFSTSGTRQTVRRNSIFSNGQLGIDLIPVETPDGVTLNDAGDADAGANNLQNFPVLTAVSDSGGTKNVQGTLNSRPNAAFTVDFYANASCDPSGHGEGETHVGSTQAITDAGGNASFSASFPSPASGQIITATATDASGNTSEFSVCHEGAAPGSVQFVAASFNVTEGGAAATVTVTRTLGSAGAFTVDYATSDGTAKAGEDYTPASGTLSFAPGETSKTFTVAVLDDALDEDAETVNLTLSNPTGGVVVGGYGAAALSVGDEDAQPRLFFEEFEVFAAEGNAGTAELTFTVRLSEPSGRAVTVNYHTEEAGALSGVDYQPASGTLTFAPGETAETITVLVNGDTAPERDDYLVLNLSGAVNAGFFINGPTTFAWGVIWDDDSAGLHFSAPNYTVAERDGSVEIGVVRRGDASSAATFFYSAAGGDTAVAEVASTRHDFTETLGRLDFAPGESAKSFTVLVNDDSYVEGRESVVLTLIDRTGGDTPTFLRAKLSITSEDAAPPPPNPVFDSQFFVRQHYHDFLNREPDAEGLAFWVNEIEKCGADAQCREVKRINVSAAFFLSIEFQETGYLAYRTYKAAYGDTTSHGVAGTVPLILLQEFLEDGGRIGQGVRVNVGNWEERLEENKRAYALEFVQRQRFLNAFPATMSADEFVTRLDQNAGGVLSASEKSELVTSLGATPEDPQKRAAVLRAVADDATLRQAEFARAFVLMQYFGYLRRNPNDTPEPNFNYAGWKFWLTKLNEFNGNYIHAEMVKAFIQSDEYRRRFGP